MIYIHKRKTPIVVKQKADAIMKAPENRYQDIVLPKDAERLRDLFDQMPKTEILDALYKEQHGLCAYCMRKIEQQQLYPMRIEHYKALSKYKELALEYQNYLGVCYGGEKDKGDKPRILCCDAARGEKELTIDPRDKRQMEAIGYKKSGEIFVRGDKGLDPALVDAMQNDLDRVLVLNGKKDADGKREYDTATKLVATRRSIYQSVCTQFERWDKKRCLTASFLKDKIELLEQRSKGDAIAEGYIGVRLYFYKRKYEQLKRWPRAGRAASGKGRADKSS